MKESDRVANVRMGRMEEFSLADEWSDADVERHLSEPS